MVEQPRDEEERVHWEDTELEIALTGESTVVFFVG